MYWCYSCFILFRPRNENEKAERKLPLPAINFNRGNPTYLVNLIELPVSKEHLRDTVFYEIYHNSILIDNIDCAKEYRKHLNGINAIAPPIYTRDGTKLASNGLMTPNKTNQNLQFVYGEMPLEDEVNEELDNLQEGKQSKWSIIVY